MSRADLVALSACEVLAAFESKTVTPNEHLAACLDEIARSNPKINALTAMDVTRATACAEAATQRWQAGTPLDVLDGLPIGVKDLQDTQGLLTTHGSIRARDHIPRTDLPMVARLRAAGAVILAKTNVPEMGAGGNSRNPLWGATGNPFDANLIAGGSSGGYAAALAANLLPPMHGLGYGWLTEDARSTVRDRWLSPFGGCDCSSNPAAGVVRHFCFGSNGTHHGRPNTDVKCLSGV